MEAGNQTKPRFKAMFVESWRPKCLTLILAVAVYYGIRTQLDPGQPIFPVPGTVPEAPTRPPAAPGLGDTLLNPIPVPIPGGDSGD